MNKICLFGMLATLVVTVSSGLLFAQGGPMGADWTIISPKK